MAVIRCALVAFSLLAYSTQIAAAQSQDLLPSAGLHFQFGGPAKSSRLQAQLSFRSMQANTLLDAEQSRLISTLSYERSAADGNALKVLGTPVLVWDVPTQSRAALQQNGQEAAPTGSWFSRNWWVVGLGVVAVGIAAAVAGGSSETNKNADTGNQTNCGVAGTVVGGPGSPTTVVDPNCVP